MKETDRKRIEERLLEERERVAKSLERLDESTRISTEDDGELTQYDQHPADDGTDTMEQEKALMLLQRESDLLTLIDEALRVLYQEEEQFGRCGSCGRDIRMERLELVPWTRLCSDCATDQETGG
ncbi:MAG: TraR/DksA C4-type zinc finger protein [Gemmatimonadota bacterium]